MEAIAQPAGDLAWPLVIALAWLAGELGRRWRIPRVTTYALVGFAFGRALPGTPGVGVAAGTSLLASIAFGLLLFEFGYRINLRWFRANPWLAAIGVLDVALTFVAVYALCRVLGAPAIGAALIAAMTAATSPAALTRVVNELHSAGPVTERALHLTAFNCVCALLAFKSIVGFWTFDTSGDLLKAFSNSAVVLMVSAGLGVAFGTGMPLILRITDRTGADATLAFALAVVLLVGLTQALRFSPLVASLAFGLVARHRRVDLSQAQRNFGVLGELLAVFLFTYVAATAEWQRALAGAAFGVALVVVRTAAKIVAVTLLARASGSTRREGLLTAVAMTPLSTFVVLLVEDTRSMGIDLIDALAPMAAATLLLQWIGPLATQFALVAAGEARQETPPRTRKRSGPALRANP